jgi:zeaxanthin glucosyltransferase
MATIAFFVDHEEGHLLPTFPLARRLREGGHQVVYLTLADAREFIERHGFPCVPILEELFPAGSLGTSRQGESAAASQFKVLPTPEEELAGRFKIYQQYLDALVRSESLGRAVAELAPDVFLVSNVFSVNALVLRFRFDRPVALISMMLRRSSKATYAREAEALLMQMRTGASAFFKLVAKARPEARRLSEVTAEFLRLRELIFCPRDLEIPSDMPADPERHYIEASVSREREAERPAGFPWERLDPSRRLLLVSMGSQSIVSREILLRFYRAVAEALAEEPEWQLVLATGSLDGAPDLPPLPEGAIAQRWVPQVALLGRAAAMINHGGLGAIKEAIVYGVPMLVFPIARDHPDNSRRVVHHGLGLAGELTRVTAEEIRRMLRQVGGDPSFHTRLEHMAQRFAELEESGIGVRLVEEMLPGNLA